VNKEKGQVMFFNPLTFLFMVIFFFCILFLLILVQVNIIALAFTKIGIPSHYIFTALLATLTGSFINIPLKRIPQETMVGSPHVSYFGFRHVIPMWHKKETILAVNLGGAVVPTILSIYLFFKTGLWGAGALATVIMSFVISPLARPVPGIGIVLPAFVPPVLAALISVVISREYAPVIAYISGTLGTLIGADLLHLRKIGQLGAPVVSIGGAGTFDGIFLNGIVAVLLAAILA
jgi:uncharacterized membrane protein